MKHLPPVARVVLLFAGLSAAWLVGCHGDSDGGAAPPATDNGHVKPGEETLPEWHGKMTIEAMDGDQLRQFIAGQKGKPVVVQLWATWSGASRRGLNELVRLQKRMGTDVVAVAVNTSAYLEARMDEKKSPEQAIEEAKSTIRPILDEADARFENVIFTGLDEELYAKLGVLGLAVIVYDPSGEIAQRFEHAQEAGEKDPFTYEKDITPLVKKLAGK